MSEPKRYTVHEWGSDDECRRTRIAIPIMAYADYAKLEDENRRLREALNKVTDCINDTCRCCGNEMCYECLLAQSNEIKAALALVRKTIVPRKIVFNPLAHEQSK